MKTYLAPMSRLVANDFKRPNCPCCYSDQIRYRHKIVLQQPVVYGSIEIEPTHTPELWECLSCESRFVQHQVPEAESIRLYADSNSGERWNTPPFDEDKTAQTVEVVSKYLTAGKSIIDVGCNTGELLDFAKSRGCQTFGVEYSAAGRAIAQAKGHQVYDRQEGAEGQQFDILTAFDLVEHLYDAGQFISFSTKALKPGGVMILHTGNGNCKLANQTRDHWWYTCLIEHITFPSRKWYASLNGLTLHEYHEIWASQYFDGQRRGPQLLKLLRQIPGVNLVAGAYTGLPAMSPDHHLVILKKE